MLLNGVMVMQTAVVTIRINFHLIQLNALILMEMVMAIIRLDSNRMIVYLL